MLVADLRPSAARRRWMVRRPHGRRHPQHLHHRRTLRTGAEANVPTPGNAPTACPWRACAPPPSPIPGQQTGNIQTPRPGRPPKASLPWDICPELTRGGGRGHHCRDRRYQPVQDAAGGPGPGGGSGGGRQVPHARPAISRCGSAGCPGSSFTLTLRTSALPRRPAAYWPLPGASITCRRCSSRPELRVRAPPARILPLWGQHPRYRSVPDDGPRAGAPVEPCPIASGCR